MSRYLERQGLSADNARAAARDYFGQDGGPPPSIDTLPPPDRGPGSAGGRGGPNAPERGARSPFESAENAPFETQRLTPDQMRRALREADTVRIEAEQVRQMAEQGETIRMTAEQLRAVAERSDTVRLTPEQQRQIAEGADTVNLTPKQMRAMADGSETVRMTPEELRAVTERSDTVRLTPEQQRRLAETSETARFSPEEASPQRPDPAPVPERELRNPELPAEREFQTEEAALRAAEPDGLLPAERQEIARLDRAIAENKNELVPEIQELNQLAERTLMQHERSAVAGRGEQFQKRLELRQRQGAAPQHEIPQGSAAADRPQPTINAGPTPRRHMVRGDSDYLNAIMGNSRFEASQNHVFAETVNSNVRAIIQEGRFPTGHNGNPQQIHLLQVGPNRYIIQNGHHRVVSAEIAARLTGRPLLPSDAIGTGLEPIIPADRLVVRTQESATQGATPRLPARDTRGWGQVGVK